MRGGRGEGLAGEGAKAGLPDDGEGGRPKRLVGRGIVEVVGVHIRGEGGTARGGLGAL